MGQGRERVVSLRVESWPSKDHRIDRYQAQEFRVILCREHRKARRA